MLPTPTVLYSWSIDASGGRTSESSLICSRFQVSLPICDSLAPFPITLGQASWDILATENKLGGVLSVRGAIFSLSHKGCGANCPRVRDPLNLDEEGRTQSISGLFYANRASATVELRTTGRKTSQGALRKRIRNTNRILVTQRGSHV